MPKQQLDSSRDKNLFALRTEQSENQNHSNRQQQEYLTENGQKFRFAAYQLRIIAKVIKKKAKYCE